MHILGLEGMPRRIYTYQPDLPWHGLNLFISISAGILAVGFLIFFVDALRSARTGRSAGDNPWDAPTLEWATSSPPPPYNFCYLPVVNSLSPLWDQAGVLAVASGLCTSRREVLVTTIAAGEPQSRESSPRNSIWPLLAAIATTIMLIWSIFSPWAVVWGSFPVAVALTGWFWPAGTPEDEA
jgi:cytochrome c oxidase subunit 1